MQTSGFFNAVQVEGVYDRKYNAKDYSDNLAVVIGNGVLRSINDDLKVTASGLIPTVAVGRAWIEGHYYLNDTPLALPAVTAPIGANRWDRIMLRLNTNQISRSIAVTYVQGTASATPTKPAPIRTGGIYDLVLADVYVTANATSITVTDTRNDANLCGWVYSTSGDNSFFTSLDNTFWTWFNSAKDTLSSVTLFKKYTYTQTLASNASTLTFNIPQYDAETCFLEVYVNGIYDSRHTVSGNIITFEGTLVAGTKVIVNCYKSIDGTGIMTVADEITELQQQYAAINGVGKFTYIATGLNDNIALSEIAQAILSKSYVPAQVSTSAANFLSKIGGNTYLASLDNEAHITIAVSGKLGVTTPVAGSGTSSNRYKWFTFGTAQTTQMRLIFDFAYCDRIIVPCSANTSNIIFYGTDIHIRNCSCLAQCTTGATHIVMSTSENVFGDMSFQKCDFKILTTGNAIIGENGTFTDCSLHAKSSGNNAYCICINNTAAFAQLVNCTTFAYNKAAGTQSAPFAILSTAANGVIMAHNINAPTVAQTGYYQTHLCAATAGMIQIIGVVSTLESGGDAQYRSVTGQIWKSKH